MTITELKKLLNRVYLADLDMANGLAGSDHPQIKMSHAKVSGRVEMTREILNALNNDRTLYMVYPGK